MINNINKFYVYELICPDTQDPFYVGKGSGLRCENHFQDALRPIHKQENKLKCSIINFYISLKKEIPIQIVKEGLSEEDAYALETQLIQQYGRLIDGTGILTNILPGGTLAEYTSKDVDCYDMKGNFIETYVSLEAAAQIVNCHKSNICGALNNRCKSAGGFRWAYHKEKLKDYNNNQHTPIIKYDLEGNKIKEYSSIAEAAQDVKIIFTSIVETCTGKHETSGGFRWSYVGQKLKPLKRSVDWYRKKKYQAMDKNNKIVGTFNTVKEAIKKTNANATGIVDCCAGRKKTSGGLKWRYVYN